MFDETELKSSANIGSGKLARRALFLLINLMSDQRHRDAVKPYGLIFDNAVPQISALQPYKQVHDLLLKVERGCYKSLVVDARDFPHHEMARVKMSNHLGILSIFLADAKGIASLAVERHDRIEEVSAQLEEAYVALQAAESLLTLDHCQRALELLQDLLSRTPSHFNVLLNEVARDLNKNSLVKAMRSLQQIISGIVLPPTVVEELQLGVEDLAQIEADLHQQIENHDNWQQLDDYLRFNPNSPDLLSKIEGSFWRILKRRVARACNLPDADETTSDWVDLVFPDDTTDKAILILIDLKKAGKRGDLMAASRGFERLIQHTADSLDSADRRLLAVCKRITEVRDPLRTLVEILR